MNFNQISYRIRHLLPLNPCLGSRINKFFQPKLTFSLNFELSLLIAFQCGSASAQVGATTTPFCAALLKFDLSVRIYLDGLEFIYFGEGGLRRHFSIPITIIGELKLF